MSQKEYGYEEILNRIRQSIDKHKENYEKSVQSFWQQEGIKLTVDSNYRSISRSRVSTENKWVMDDGAIAFCKDYKVYKLKTDFLNYQIQDHGIYREIDWRGKHTRVSCFVEDQTQFTINGRPIGIKGLTDRSFESLEVKGRGISIEMNVRGSIQTTASEVQIVLHKQN